MNLRTKRPTDDSDPEVRAALTALLNKLRRWEEANPVYQEMLASANRRVEDENVRKAAALHG